ncbi:MAG: hypothetical protein D6704_03570 [Nitrospirae bacterium]|nr:MAG: hypothetical protein D6704_03570 [Nitrospirota bacterium]
MGSSIVELAKGTAQEAHVGETAIVHYTGWLEGGMKFDGSQDCNEPISFGLGANRIIPPL